MNKIVEFMKHNKLKKITIANSLGISRQWFYQVLRTGNIRAQDLEKIASAAGAHLCIVKDNEVIVKFTEDDFKSF